MATLCSREPHLMWEGHGGEAGANRVGIPETKTALSASYA
jgi:hypothetical protein